jgi:hypothetical protein
MAQAMNCTCPSARCRKPRASLVLYSWSADSSSRRMRVIVVSICHSSDFDVSTSLPGGSSWSARHIAVVTFLPNVSIYYDTNTADSSACVFQ